MHEIEHSQHLPGDYREAPLPASAQAALVVLAYLSNTQLPSKNASYVVLRSLAEMTEDRAKAGLSTEFTTLNLFSAVKPNTTKDPSAWLSPNWTKLIEAEKQWQEGMVEAAGRVGSTYLPKLLKIPGNPARYQIQAVPWVSDPPQNTVQVIPAGGIYYIPEQVSAPGGWIRTAYRSGIIPWTTPARLTLTLLIMTLLLGGIGIVWQAWQLAIQIPRPLTLADLAVVAAFLVVPWVLIRIFRETEKLFDYRIIMAPSFLTSISENNVTLELRPSTTDSLGQMVFAKYTSSCALCGGSVEIFDGGEEFPGRLVGRCRRSAREHVYTFDHVSRVGSLVRRMD